MKKILALVLMMAAALPQAVSAQKKEVPSELKVMSYNIRLATGKDGTNSWEYR